MPEDLRFAARERTGPRGVVEPLPDSELDRVTDSSRSCRAESVAVCLLFSYLDSAHERAVAERLRDELPELQVSASHEVLPQFREYERCSTTVIDAYLSPLLGRYLDDSPSAASQRGLPEPMVMRSSGGVAPAAEAAGRGRGACSPVPQAAPSARGFWPACPATATRWGSTWAAPPATSASSRKVRCAGPTRARIAGRVIQLPMVDVHTVGAGGGSIGWRDSGGALRVGPQSAGAEPGPACYGRGGTEPTVTDANLLLGYLGAASTLAGGVELERRGARSDPTARGRTRTRRARRRPRG